MLVGLLKAETSDGAWFGCTIAVSVKVCSIVGKDFCFKTAVGDADGAVLARLLETEPSDGDWFGCVITEFVIFFSIAGEGFGSEVAVGDTDGAALVCLLETVTFTPKVVFPSNTSVDFSFMSVTKVEVTFKFVALLVTGDMFGTTFPSSVSVGAVAFSFEFVALTNTLSPSKLGLEAGTVIAFNVSFTFVEDGTRAGIDSELKPATGAARSLLPPPSLLSSLSPTFLTPSPFPSTTALPSFSIRVLTFAPPPCSTFSFFTFFSQDAQLDVNSNNNASQRTFDGVPFILQMFFSMKLEISEG
mmetsp:Transcript_17654/g.22896  ORF Transcript_17654/g.22896 Transcript_17654/m.22896 type:complete len:301 (+) Transcript_17654:1870-2772(+)